MATCFESSVKLGSLVRVRYLDHVLFRNVNPETQRPVIQEVVGWLHNQNTDSVCLLVAQYSEPRLEGSGRLKGTGFSIVKKAILEIRKIE